MLLLLDVIAFGVYRRANPSSTRPRLTTGVNRSPNGLGRVEYLRLFIDGLAFDAVVVTLETHSKDIPRKY